MKRQKHLGSYGFAALLAVAVYITFALLDANAAREEQAELTRSEIRMLDWLELDEAEWHKYHSLRTAVGRPLAEMTPYEVLGIYADDLEQRRRYARANARFMLDFYRRTTEFEELYRAEISKLSTK